MHEEAAIEVLGALAHPKRVAVFRLLVQSAPNDVPALAIAAHLAAKPSTMSGHLTVLRHAGLITVKRNQRELRYAAHLPTINNVIRFLLSDCCGGRIGNCNDILSLLCPEEAP